MKTAELSPRASADLLDIYLYGIRVFGPRQADTYLGSFERCFAILAANPRMGRKADAVGKGLRRHEHTAHVVFYEEAAAGVLVVAILHGRQLPDLDRI